jgi:phospholipid/cholesterol/gamma-HCH transport system ATP-binding protein
MIVVKDVHKRFGDRRVLDGISFGIDRAEVTTIIGRSGGGKSVLLKQMIGLDTPDSGEILIDGVNVVGLAADELNRMRRRFGVLFQEGALFDFLTAQENIAFPLREHSGFSESEIAEIVRAKLETVALTGHGEKYPSQLSGGMRRRVALARALAMDPEIVFFDEPTTGLDPITAAAIYDTIIRTHEESRTTYVMVSHDIAGAFAVSNEIMMLWEGRIVESGSPEHMRNSGNEIVRRFISGPYGCENLNR